MLDPVPHQPASDPPPYGQPATDQAASVPAGQSGSETHSPELPEFGAGVFARLKEVGGDLKDPRWIYAKGFLFLLSGMLAGGLLLIEHPTWKDAALLAMTVWCFSRFYYFAFYVIEHYIDGEYKFAGLGSFVMYLLRRRR